MTGTVERRATIMPDVVNVGEKIALARNYHAPKLIQSELARVMGVARSTVARWETTGEVPPREVTRLAAYFGLDERWFYDGGDTPPTLARVRDSAVSNATVASDAIASANGSRTSVETEVELPVWRGVAASGVYELVFQVDLDSEPERVPSLLLAGKPAKLFVVCIVSGSSMSPRAEQGDRVLVRLDPDPPLGTLALAQGPDGCHYFKQLSRGREGYELRSYAPGVDPIVLGDGWTIVGYATAIVHPYVGQGPNMEWDFGRPLRS